MTRKRRTLDELLSQSPIPSSEEMHSRLDNIWERLRSEVDDAPQERIAISISLRPAWTLVAVIVVLVPVAIASVVGTIFHVRTEETSSRAAVVQREARVEQNGKTTESRAGQQTVPTPPRLEFELATVRPLAPPSKPSTAEPSSISGCRDGGWIGAIQIDAGRVVIPAVTPFSLLMMAYGQDCFLIDGAPEWIRSERFHVEALFPPGIPTYTRRDLTEGKAPQLQKMLQSLLADRFKLVVRRETKEMSVFTLVVSKEGKLKSSEDQTSPGVPEPFKRGGPLSRGSTSLAILPEQVSYSAVAVPLWEFTKILQGQVGLPVVDKTGRKGLFDLRLEFAKETAALPNGPMLPTALQEQLGLKLVPAKLPMDVLVIGRIERPSEN